MLGSSLLNTTQMPVISLNTPLEIVQLLWCLGPYQNLNRMDYNALITCDLLSLSVNNFPFTKLNENDSVKNSQA